ncbi:MAG: hypothetical protein MUF87_18810 [Anaerolineae bacterium]|jgi:hypothetical protein|nr:hypothetical protein [Anaerolineae bacterium]
MKCFWKAGFVALLLLITSSVSMVIARQADSLYGFGITHNEGEQTILTIVDTTGIVEEFTLPVPTGFTLLEALASPNGDWISLYSVNNEAQTHIQLFHLLNNEVRDVVTGIDTSFGDLPPANFLPVWSPDSRYLAFNVISVFGGAIDTLIYSLVDNQVHTAFAGFTQLYPYEVAWSANSAQLAIATMRCTANNGRSLCETLIQVIEVPSLNVQNMAEISVETGKACELKWSPNGKYIAFLFDCDVSNIYFFEVFLLDVAQNAIQPLTTLTNPVPLVNTLLLGYRNTYDFTWSDISELLIGVIAAQGGSEIDPTTLSIGSFTYLVPDSLTTQVSEEMGREWSQNPVNTSVAYRAETWELDSSNQLVVTSRQSRIAMLSAGQFTFLVNGSAGCDYRWSPDGQMLTYRNVENQTTLGIICEVASELVLYISLNDQFITFPFNKGEQSVGWLRLLKPSP